MFLRQTYYIVHKDLQREFRTREITTTTVAFAVLLVVIFTFGFFQNDDTVGIVFPGILWIAVIFSGTLAIGRSFAQEKESGCLRALSLVPRIAASLFVGKWVVNVLFMLAFEAVLFPLLALAFNVKVATQLPSYLFTLLFGTIGFAALGTLLAAMLVHSHLRDALLPLLLYPLLIPLLIVGVKISAMLYEGALWGDVLPWMQLMLVMDLIYMGMGLFLFRWVLSSIE